MVIKASSSAEVRQLVAALTGDHDVAREVAIARIAVIGGRAVDKLIAAYDASPARPARIAILRALEPIGDGRTLRIAREALTQGGDLAVAGAGVLRGLADSPHEATAAEALDALVAAALDRAGGDRVRLAAFDALQDIPDVRARVAAALRDDPDPAIRAGAGETSRDVAAAEAVWQDALCGRFPDQPSVLRDALQTHGAAAPLTTLQKMIDGVHAHEGSLAAAQARADWRNLRGALHQTLALRDSRVALYDLRESVEESREPLPVSFLAALHVVGEASCLEPLAAAHGRATDDRWRHQLQEAFRAIMRRERLTTRSASVKKILGRWPAIGE